MTSDGKPDYVWYGGDDTGQRLRWFLSREKRYDCADVFKTAETAWRKRFGTAAPDLGRVGGDDQVALVAWDETAQFLKITVESSRQAKVRNVNLSVAPGDFVQCRHMDVGPGF